MMTEFELILLIVGLLLFSSVIASKYSGKIKMPALLLFLLIGMIAGSDGPGGLYFDDYKLSQMISVIALIFILFSGGLETNKNQIKSVMGKGLLLSTMGVAITAVIFGMFAKIFMSLTWLEGLLLGSIIASTDAAAVFSILRSKQIGVKNEIQSLAEFESGSNDPMAILLTITFIELITKPSLPIFQLIGLLIWQIVWGALAGYFAARGVVWLSKKLRIETEGIYLVITIAFSIFIYSVVNLTKGSGFLALYISGIIIGNGQILRKKTISRFHNAIAWLMQIIMFLTLGLLVFPKKLIPLAGIGILLSFILIFIARPVSVIACLSLFKMKFKEKVMVSWLGMRGAVPIVLAIFPLTRGIQKSEIMFNIVFFIVLISILLQGTTIPFVAKLLKVNIPLNKRKKSPIEFEPENELSSELIEYEIQENSQAIGKTLKEIDFPKGCIVVLIDRNNDYIVPEAFTVILSGDILFVMIKKALLKDFTAKLAALEPVKEK